MAYALDFQRVFATKNSNFIYVDSWNGDDLLGDGSQNKPVKSLARALALTNNNVVARGYFSENVTSSRVLLSDKFGEAIFDGKGLYNINGTQIVTAAYTPINGFIVLNTSVGAGIVVTQCVGSFLINTVMANPSISGTQDAHKYSVIRNLKSINGLHLSAQVAGSMNNIFMDMTTAARRNSTSTTHTNNIYDNCKIYLDVYGSASAPKFDTCLFRSNCSFWYRGASADVRLDADGQTASQKEALVNDWLVNGTLQANYVKYLFVSCRFTDNKIVHAPDGATDGYDLDYSLIYGDEATQPACWMDGGKHIGPIAPSMKIEFKETASQTASPYEVEIKPTDKLTLANGRVSLNADFTGATLYSKPMPIPNPTYTTFNGLNVSFINDPGTRGVFVSPPENISLEEALKMEVTIAGVALALNKVYVVKCDDGAYVSYRGNVYTQGCCITGNDTTSLATLGGTGAAFLYAIRRPEVFSTVKLKLWENGTLPADFATNDATYPYINAPTFNLMGDKTMETGLRCLRVGNVASGAIEVGTDGVKLTNAHPEFYSTANASRAKFPIRANWVMLKIEITELL